MYEEEAFSYAINLSRLRSL